MRITSELLGNGPFMVGSKISPTYYGAFGRERVDVIQFERNSDRSDFQKGPRKSNLPKVLFAEWFSLDQFSDQNSDLPKNNFGYNNSEFQDAFMHDLYMSEGVDNETVYDDMFQAQPKSEDQMYANGLDELLCSEFSINSDVINVHISHLYNEL
ncbi:hypothetical protein HAX54_016948 [Datura stramonium]|uniref:Uncharacterized protein n=1 Tax=Datura stramonium TaxID=4076 RepID=A0ABS8Y842_DATST|nr:hypothetical protein [Datura stramonium]